MSRLFARGGAAVLAGLCLLLLGLAVAATGKSAVSCDARAGTTLLEGAGGRVFSYHRLIYACARPSGRVHRVAARAGGGGVAVYVSDVQLAGGYVAWLETDSSPVAATDSLELLDLRRGTIRVVARIGSAEAANLDFAGDVVNAHGTVVYIKQENGMNSWVYENTARRTTLLDHETWPSTTGPAPIGSLGLSYSGSVAYWLDQGQFRGATIP